MIFLGTVVQELQPPLFLMRIDKAYKGVSQKTVVLYDSGMCDGPNLRAGEQYLMYTGDDGSGYIPSRGCTRSRHVKYAAEDLKFLNGLSSAPPTGTIFGQVTVNSGGMYSKGDPAAGVRVEISRGEKTLATLTGGDGRYSFAGLKPGVYSAKGTRAGFRMSASESDEPVVLEPRTCAELDVVLRRIEHGTIQGRVRQADGTPAAGIKADLIRVKGEGPDAKRELLIGFTVQTNQRGEYAFEGVAPGDYKVVLNLYRPPTTEDPYKTVYWPEGSSEAAGSVVGIRADALSRQCDFRLPPALESRPVQVTVLLPDGTPARGARANIGTRMDGMFQWAGHATTDASGQFVYSAIEGFDYTVQDVFSHNARMASAVHFSAADSGQPIIIRLVPSGSPK